jgi:hypothetical protein
MNWYLHIVSLFIMIYRDAIKRSRNRTASMDLFAGLIGELSNIRFASVSDRFIAELEKYNSHTIMKERQSHMEMLISGMRFLKIKVLYSNRIYFDDPCLSILPYLCLFFWI